MSAANEGKPFQNTTAWRGNIGMAAFRKRGVQQSVVLDIVNSPATGTAISVISYVA